MRNYTVIEGLDDIGRFDLSAYLSWKTVTLFSGNFAEFLNPPDGSGHGVKRYVWTASQYVQILIERIFGIRYSNYLGSISIMPNIPTSCYGKELALRDLPLPGGARMDVAVTSTTDGSEITVKYNITPGDINDSKKLVVALPSYGESYKAVDCAYEVRRHNRGNICEKISDITLAPGADAISGEVKFVK